MFQVKIFIYNLFYPMK